MATSISTEKMRAIYVLQTAEIIYTHDFWFLTEFFSKSAAECVLCAQGPVDVKNSGWIGPQYSGVDIETEGVLSPHQGAIATVQVELNGICWVVHIDKNNTLIDVPGVELFRAYLENRQVTKVIHNASFELKFFLHTFGYGLECEPIHDTMAGEYILAKGLGFIDDETDNADGNRKMFGMFGLGPTVKRRYAVDMDKDKELRSGFRRRGTTQIVPAAIKGGHPLCNVAGCREDSDIYKGSKGREVYLCMGHATHPIASRLRTVEAVDPNLYVDEVIQHLDLTQRQLEYAAFDALWVAMLAQDQIEIMTQLDVYQGENFFNVFRLDCQTAEAIARMELHGMPLNMDDLLCLGCEYQYDSTQRLERTQSALFLPGDTEVIKVSSWQQMVPRLNAVGIPVASYQTADLKRFKGNPIIDDILKFKRLQKLIGTYVEGFINRCEPSTGRIHCNFNQFITSTGRLSSSNPNLQNLPSRDPLGALIRECVQAPAGYTFIIADYSQIELRLIAEMFRDFSMRQAFNEDKDLHSLMGAQVMGVTYDFFVDRVAMGDKVYKMARTNAKVCNFGLGYGAGAPKLQIMAWVQYDLDWDMAETRRNKAMFDNMWPGVKAYHNHVSNDIKMGTGIYSVKTQDGRVREMEREWYNKQGQKRTCFSAALNHPIQGTSADMIKKVMVKLCRQMQFILQVHDELVAMVRIEDADRMLHLLKTTMEEIGQTYLKTIPIGVDAKISSVWSK